MFAADAFMEYASQHELDLSSLTDLDSSVAKIGLLQDAFCHKRYVTASPTQNVQMLIHAGPVSYLELS